MDLLVDTNSLPYILKKIDKVIERCDHIYVPRCVLTKEAPSVFKGLTNIEYNLRELKSNRILYDKQPKKHLPKKLNDALEKIKPKVSDCDKDILKLALERKKKGRFIIITKNDEHFQDAPEVMNCVGRGNIVHPEEYNC